MRSVIVEQMEKEVREQEDYEELSALAQKRAEEDLRKIARGIRKEVEVCKQSDC